MAYRCVRRLSATISSMAMAKVCQRKSEGPNYDSLCTVANGSFNPSKPFINPFQVQVKRKLASATSALKSVLGQGETSDKLEQLKDRMAIVWDLFRNSNTTEFVIATIPTDQNKYDPELACLRLVQALLIDSEIRGIPALKFMGDMIWR